MKLSACTAAFGMADLKKIIDTSARLGYDAVEITAALHLPVESSKERRKEVLDWIKDAGITCSGLHYIFDGSIRLLSTDKDMRKKSAEYLKKVVDLAADMEAPTIILGSGGKTRSFEEGWDREAGVKCFADTLHQAGEYAADKNVVFAVEAINRYETNFINTLEEAVRFTEMVNLPNVQTMTDTYHINIEEKNIGDTIRKYGHTLANIHLADSNRQAPGDGHFPFQEVADALKDIGWNKTCSFEVFGLYPWKLWYDTFEESVEHMGNGVKYARRIFG